MLAILIVGGLAAVLLLRRKPAEQASTPTPVIAVSRAQSADVPVVISAIGTVEPIVAATVRTQLAGVLFSINFKEGAQVRKGTLLAQVDPRPYRLALSQAKGTLARDQAQLDVARVQLERYRRLLTQDSIARQEVDSQAATVKQLEGTVQADSAAVGDARLNLEYTSIRAPVSGQVGLRHADVGDYVTPSDAQGLVEITQHSPIDVSFAIPQDQLGIVQRRARREGLPVTVSDQSGARVLARGRFLTLDNQVDTNTGTVPAKARFSNSERTLYPNQFVNVSLLVDTLQGVVTIPLGAVRHGPQGDFVFLLKPDDTVRLQQVTTGPSAEGRVAILKGVSSGQLVVTNGADALDDGDKVAIEKADAVGSAAAPGR